MLSTTEKKRLRTLQEYIRSGLTLNQSQQNELIELLSKRDFEINERGHESWQTLKLLNNM